MITTQFLQNCQAGDETAIETLVRTHQRGVFQLALSILDDAPLALQPGEADQLVTGTKAGSAAAIAAPAIAAAAAEAETATRETFTAALDHLGRYREEVPFTTWLYAIAIQTAQRRMRRWKLRRWWYQMAGQHIERIWQATFRQPGGAAASLAPEAIHFLPGDLEMWSAVRRLDERLRIPVVLRYYHDFPISEIARVLHLSEGGVHARLDAAREKIALALEK